MIKLYLFLEDREKNKKKNYGIRQITELKISSRNRYFCERKLRKSAKIFSVMIVNRDKYLPLLRIDDSFMKYVITGDIIKKYQNDDGIVFMDVFDFL